MHKDVKFGLAIGGILLAIVVLYLIVAGVSENNLDTVQLVDESGRPIADPVPVAAASDDRAGAPVERGQPPLAGSAEAAQAPVEASSAEPAEDVWARAWRMRRLPTLMTETPSGTSPPARQEVLPPSPLEEEGAAEDVEGAALEPAPSAISVEPPTLEVERPTVDVRPRMADPEALLATPVLPPTTQPISGERKHVVQSGENFSSIAARTYGSPNYWPHIARRNPHLESSRLKIGSIVILPDPAEVKAPAAPIAAPALSRRIDSAMEYVVEKGDSLYTISMKLYGKGDRQEKLHEWNRQTIGPDPNKLKIGMVLKLQEPPTASASAR